jgi:hypothetical protein
VLDVRTSGTIALHCDLRRDKPQPLKEWQLVWATCAENPRDSRIIASDSAHERSPYALAPVRAVNHNHREVAIGKIVADAASESNDLAIFYRNKCSLRLRHELAENDRVGNTVRQPFSDSRRRASSTSDF